MQGVSIFSQSLRFAAISPERKQALVKAFKENRLLVVDVDNQDDFIHAKGPRQGLPVPGAEAIKSNLKKLTDLFAKLKLPYIATVDTHTPDDPEFALFTDISDSHCVKNTPGWQKIFETILPGKKPHIVDVDPSVKDTPTEEQAKAFAKDGRPIYVEKNTFSVFSNPKADATFKNTKTDTAIVHGVVTEICVKEAVKGLKERGYDVYVVEDAIKELEHKPTSPEMKDTFCDVTLVTTEDLQKAFTEK
jgi:nicotinamidase/pyrazinamidase